MYIYLEKNDIYKKYDNALLFTFVTIFLMRSLIFFYMMCCIFDWFDISVQSASSSSSLFMRENDSTSLTNFIF